MVRVAGERVRLYVRGTILGYKRSKSNQYSNTSLIQIEGVNSKEEIAWYQGKIMMYIYKAKVKQPGPILSLIDGATRGSSGQGFQVTNFSSVAVISTRTGKVASDLFV